MLAAVAQGQADIAVSCLSITQEREAIVDFSHSCYETHLAIAVKQHGFLQTLKNFFYNERLFIALGIIVGVSITLGNDAPRKRLKKRVFLFGLTTDVNGEGTEWGLKVSVQVSGIRSQCNGK